MKPNKRFAVTGGIGSGKSEVLAILRKMGYPVFSCDEFSHALWREEEYRKGLAEVFPACSRAGEIDKAELTRLVFSDEAALARLNAYAHPRIMTRLLSLTAGVPLSFCEVPLLFEGGYVGEFDGAIVVLRSRADRMQAVCARDGLSEAEAEARFSKQYDYACLPEGNFAVVENNGSLEDLSSRVAAALMQLKIE